RLHDPHEATSVYIGGASPARFDPPRDDARPILTDDALGQSAGGGAEPAILEDEGPQREEDVAQALLRLEESPAKLLQVGHRRGNVLLSPALRELDAQGRVCERLRDAVVEIACQPMAFFLCHLHDPESLGSEGPRKLNVLERNAGRGGERFSVSLVIRSKRSAGVVYGLQHAEAPPVPRVDG